MKKGIRSSFDGNRINIRVVGQGGRHCQSCWYRKDGVG